MEENPNKVLTFEQSRATALKATAVLFARARRSGNPALDKDTLYSDVCMTWIKCRDNYNENFGVPFLAYFYMSAVRNYGMFARDAFNEVSANSSSVDSLFDGDGDGNGHDYNENLTDHSIDTEALVSKRQRLRQMADKFPLLAALLELIANPPDDLKNELTACAAQGELAQRLGYNVDAVPTALSFDILSNMFGLNWRQRKKLSEEMENAAEYIS